MFEVWFCAFCAILAWVALLLIHRQIKFMHEISDSFASSMRESNKAMKTMWETRDE